jgi:hypothetical protein
VGDASFVFCLLSFVFLSSCHLVIHSSSSARRSTIDDRRSFDPLDRDWAGLPAVVSSLVQLV